jgi:hypothetical protein
MESLMPSKKPSKTKDFDKEVGRLYGSGAVAKTQCYVH